MARRKGGHSAGSQPLCSWSIEQGKGRETLLRQDLCSYIFSWVIECLWLGCVATIRDLRNKNIRVFFPVAVYSFRSKIFCSRWQRHGMESRGRQSSSMAFTRAPLKQSLFFSFRPKPHNVCRPRRASLWDAEQLPGLPGTVTAVGSPRWYWLWSVHGLLCCVWTGHHGVLRYTSVHL